MGKTNKLVIEYDPLKGGAMPDGVAKVHVDGIIKMYYEREDKHSGYHLTYSTENVFSHFRIAVQEGKIGVEDILFKYKEDLLRLNKYGVIENWPANFLNNSSVLASKLLRNSLEIRKQESKKINGR